MDRPELQASNKPSRAERPCKKNRSQVTMADNPLYYIEPTNQIFGPIINLSNFFSDFWQFSKIWLHLDAANKAVRFSLTVVAT